MNADQKKALQAQSLDAERALPLVSSDTKTARSASVTANLWKWLVVIAILLLSGIWFASKFGTRESKDPVIQLASQPGIGTQVMPWSDRAETVARKLIEQNAVWVATAIQAILHPRGADPAVTNTSIAKFDDRIVVDVTVSWKGMVGTTYQTDVAWEISKAGHIAAKVHADSAPIDPSTRSNKETVLDDYFRTKVYPAFRSSINP